MERWVNGKIHEMKLHLLWISMQLPNSKASDAVWNIRWKCLQCCDASPFIAAWNNTTPMQSECVVRLISPDKLSNFSQWFFIIKAQHFSIMLMWPMQYVCCKYKNLCTLMPYNLRIVYKLYRTVLTVKNELAWKGMLNALYVYTYVHVYSGALSMIL